jgi:hypothetical protein
MPDDVDNRPAWALGRQHAFGVVAIGTVTCAACGRTYDENTMWQADVDPCVDGRPTGISEQLAKARAAEAVRRLLGECR